MVTKRKQKAGKKKSRKGRVKSLYLKPEIKTLIGGEQKKIKGGSGLSGGVVNPVSGRNLADS